MTDFIATHSPLPVLTAEDRTYIRNNFHTLEELCLGRTGAPAEHRSQIGALRHCAFREPAEPSEIHRARAGKVPLMFLPAVKQEIATKNAKTTKRQKLRPRFSFSYPFPSLCALCVLLRLFFRAVAGRAHSQFFRLKNRIIPVATAPINMSTAG
jgi:hypothetical protein